jgi:hypothetical protein
VTTPESAPLSPVTRRRLLALGGTAAAGVAAVGTASSASAATAGTAWQCGGNTGITTDGSNYLGTKNSAPLIFKTTPSGGAPTERMRISALGRIGIGTTAPAMLLDALGTTGAVIRGVNTSTSATAIGVNGVSATGFGVAGGSTSGAGVRGKSGSGPGVLGQTTSDSGVTGTSTQNMGVHGTGGYAGVRGDGGTYGAILVGDSYGAYCVGGPTGVFGIGTSIGLSGSGAIGVYGSSTDPNSASVKGDGGKYGVYGVNGGTAGVRGESGYVGVWGEAPSYGVYGLTNLATGTGYGVFGQSSNADSYGLYSLGNCGVQGTLIKLAGSFKIDHPLDPERQWLSHSFVESPDMLNVYNGVVVLDSAGAADVELPDYFEALNRDFRYQLTPIGGAAPNLHIAAEVSGNAFSIAGGSAGLKVSWQVTGVRHDDYAVAHPIVVEQPKTGEEHGARVFVPPGSSARAFAPSLSTTPTTPTTHVDIALPSALPSRS